MKQVHEVGAELRAALEERECALGASEVRALSVLLIDLITSGLLVSAQDETAPANNMGQPVCITEESK